VSIRSFSGVRAWDAAALNDTDADPATAAKIIDNIALEHCPRCEGPLPKAPDLPAGSRITRCRTIPICSQCGSEEAEDFMAAFRGSGKGMLAASEWPVQPINLRADGFEEAAARVPLYPTAARNPHSTGGWVQYGWNG
jgi:hypothetical protein